MHTRVSRRSFILLAAALGLGACSATTATTPAAAPEASATLGGSGGGTTLLKHIVGPYLEGSPTLALDFLQGSGSGPAKRAVLSGKLDVAILLSTDIGAEQQDGLVLLPLAEDPVAFAVHPALPVDMLTPEQLRDIYLGKITNWSEVGGPDALIVVLARDEDEGTTKILRKILFGAKPWADGAVVLTKASDLTDAVIGTPNSIGFGSYGGFEINGGVKVIAVGKVHPRDYGAERYAFPARTLALMYAPDNTQRLQPLLDYLKGANTRSRMAQAGIVPLS